MQANRSKRRKKSKGPAILLVLLVLIVICVVLVLGTMNYIKKYDKAYNSGSMEQISFEIKRGESTSGISKELQDKGLIENAYIFKFKSEMLKLDGKYQAGTYVLSPSMTMSEIMSALQNAQRETKRFTIPEGYNLWQIGQSLEEQGIIPGADDFYSALEDDYSYSFLDGINEYSKGYGGISARANRLEGFLFPETYEIFADATPHQIIDKLLSQFESVLKQSGYENTGISVFELVTRASLIEREAGVDSDRPIIASVINNRLNKGMQLQLDATVQYALGETKERLLYSDLEIDSPYNTYVISGLPIGPIGCPGKASIEAVVNPAKTDYIYYVLKPDGSGEHNFAEDYNTFLKYKKQYTDSF